VTHLDTCSGRVYEVELDTRAQGWTKPTNSQVVSERQEEHMSRETATIFGRGTILEASTSHIGQGVALVAQTAAFVYIYVRISQIVEMTLSFHATAYDSATCLHQPNFLC